MAIIEDINYPSDIKNLSRDELKTLAKEVGNLLLKVFP